MHIPDGYLSPATCAATYAVTAACAVYASKKVSKELDEKKIPLIALAAAFSFVIMMFNIPIPGGTTGHAVGGTLIGILLGPWAAMLAATGCGWVLRLLFGLCVLASGCALFGVLFSVLPGWAFRIVL